MKGNDGFQGIPDEEREWIDAYVDGRIGPGEFEALQDRLEESASLRAAFRRYLALDESLAGDFGIVGEGGQWLEAAVPEPEGRGRVVRFPGLVPVALAAGLAFLLGLGFMYVGYRSDDGGDAVAEKSGEEPSAEGFASILRTVDLRLEDGERERGAGATLGAETFRIASGMVEIQFFSGAKMTVEGPAEITLKSAWEAVCREGAVRISVPPAARGFRLSAPDTEIVDLGTEFGLVVRGGKSHVEVIDGEISLSHRGGEERLMTKGDALELAPDRPAEVAESGRLSFPDTGRFGSRELVEKRADFERWRSYAESVARDERLVAYYTLEREPGSQLVPNASVPRNEECDGAVVLAEPVDGRWPGLKEALEFRRPGARVRVNIPGEYPAFSFVAWVRIDSLDRWYNALFMGDGYETGEPHWQIRDDGKMMLSVMVDDSRPNPGSPNDAGFHRVYYSPPMWDLSMSGQWLHLASVFDPENRQVSHYVDGERIHRQEIEDRFLIEKLRIGSAEIGNWGQPFREDPVFAIRNLNGRMDEIAIYGAALSDEEIADLHERSRAFKRVGR